jgi:beta-mannanase
VTDVGSWDASVAAHEAAIGRRLDVAHAYHQWGDAFPTAAEQRVAARGTDLFLAWKPDVPWRRVASGAEDATIDAAASRVAGFGRRVYIAFHHEPEDQVGSSYGSAADYAAAFRHVVERFRARGVGNAVFVWNVMGAVKWYGLYTGGLYPGDDVVDWIAWDPYNWGACRGERWTSFAGVVAPFYSWLGAHGHGDKPFMLGEYGTVDDPGQPGRKADWFAGERSQVAQFPNLRALVYFDRNQDCDWRVGSAPGSLAAYRALAAAVG